MRYAIVSDLHANAAAWQAVLADIADLRAEKIICLGDVVGYGPAPVEVLESVYRHVHVTLLGNHDAGACGLCDTSAFSDRARQALDYHRKALSPSALRWLRGLPYLHGEGGFCCAHGDFSRPREFLYIDEPETALPSWAARGEALLFAGHSHLPGIYVIRGGGAPHYVPPCDFELEPGKRYIVNPGSVGYPRAGDRRSSYCLYDSAARTILFRQLPFDTAGYRAEMARLGWKDDGWILEKERERAPADLRGRPSFSRGGRRPAAPGRARRRIRAAAIAAALCALSGIGAALLAGRRRATHPASPAAAPPAAPAAAAPAATAVLPEPPVREPPVLSARPLTPGRNFLPPWPAEIRPGGGLAGWRTPPPGPAGRTLSLVSSGEGPALRIRHETRSKTRIESAFIDLSGTELKAVRLTCRALPGKTFAGTAEAGIRMFKRLPDGGYADLKPVTHALRGQKKKDAGLALNRKIPLLSQTARIRFFWEGEFQGELDLPRPFLGAAAPAAAGKRRKP